MKQEPLVSIVLPTYNGSNFIRESIESIICQTYKNWELIIVNDYSTDNTEEIINEYLKIDNRIKLINNVQNLRVSASLNIGFSQATGQYYTWTSDDNFYKQNAIETMVNYLESNKNVDFVSAKFDVVKEDKTFIREFGGNWERTPEKLAFSCNIGACFMYTEYIAKRVGEYDTKIFCGEDYDYWCRVAIVGNIAYIDDNLYCYRENSQSLTAKKKDLLEKHSLEICLKYAVPILNKYVNNNNKINKILLNNYIERTNLGWLLLAFKQNCVLTPLNLIIQLVDKIIGIVVQDINFYKTLVTAKENTALWGASIFLEKLLKRYNIKNKKIVCIIDKNPRKINQYIGPYKIISPEEINQYNIKRIILTIQNNNQNVYKTLQKEIQDNYPEILLNKNIFVC